MRLGVVIPATHGREENLSLVIESFVAQGFKGPFVVVDDGGDLDCSDLGFAFGGADSGIVIKLAKHHPGMEQPRNVGVRAFDHFNGGYAGDRVTHAWFVDSDVVVKFGAVAEVEAALDRDPDRILVGPYDWLQEGQRPTGDDWAGFWRLVMPTRNDPRWAMFTMSPMSRRYVNDLSAGLACFSGNLVWPIDRFIYTGGFWSEIHHGRCEDGELGLRAVAMEVPISLLSEARGFHLWHPRNDALALERNERDVPMLNARHPWVEGPGVFMSDRDGKAFDVNCACGNVIHTIGWWEHASLCPHTAMALPVEPVK